MLSNLDQKKKSRLIKDVDILDIQHDLIHLPGTFDSKEIY